MSAGLRGFKRLLCGRKIVGSASVGGRHELL